MTKLGTAWEGPGSASKKVGSGREGIEGVVGTWGVISWISWPGSGTWLAGRLAGASTVTLMTEPLSMRTSNVRRTADAGREANISAAATNAALSSAKRSL